MDTFFSQQSSYLLEIPQNDLSQTCSLFCMHQQVPRAQQGQQINQNQIKSNRKRVNNNIFKTPLSQFRKMVLTQLKQDHIELNQFRQINKKKNMSTFLKLILLVQHYKIKNQIQLKFSSTMQRLLQKKKDKIQKKRYEQLQKIVKKMSNSLKSNNLEEMISEYWGDYRQKSKYVECVLELKQFKEKIKM